MSSAAATAPSRLGYVDVFRGLLIAHMALDHASLIFNTGRGGEELARAVPEPPADFFQFLTRFTGVSVAPGFCFMAGFMVALTTAARERRGVSPSAITRRLVVRGLVLIAVDALIMGLPRAAAGFYSFMVLSSIGVAIILVALLRRLPQGALLALALAILALHPLLDVSALPVPLQAVLHEPVRTGAFRSLYPVIPWFGITLAGFVAGRDADTRQRPTRLWLSLAATSLAAFFLIRVPAGYGNAYPHAGIGSQEFWSFAKYPPDLAFLSWSFALTFLSLVLLERICRTGVPRLLAPFVTYGRVPFFFYVVHFYLLGISAAVSHLRVGLAGTYGIWLLLLVAMLPLCAWYYRKKRDRPNLVTRYL